MDILGAPAVVIDFETYYDAECSLNRLSVQEYLAHPRFKVHGMAWMHGDYLGFVPEAEIPVKLSALANLPPITVVGHNLLFDAHLLYNLYGFRNVAGWVDTLFLARNVWGPLASGLSLAVVAARLKLPVQKGDLGFMKGVANPSPEQTAALRSYAINDARITQMVCQRLLRFVSRPDVELAVMSDTIRLAVEHPLRLDTAAIEQALAAGESAQASAIADANGGTVTVDVLVKGKTGRKTIPDEPDRIERRRLSVTRGLLTGKMFEAALQTAGCLPTKRVRDAASGQARTIPALSRKDPELTALLVDPKVPGEIKTLIRARQNVKALDTGLARLRTMRKMDGKLHVELAYHGARTGRFAGGGGFNIQNLTDPARTLPVARPLAEAALRAILPSKPGHVFVTVDASQIEARVLAWLANQTDLIHAFSCGSDVYSSFITDALGLGKNPVRRAQPTDAPDVARRMTALRQLGKTCILGLGYSMGRAKFMAGLRADPLVVSMIDAGELDEDELSGLVGAYRDMYPHIPAYWNAAYHAFTAAMSTESQSFQLPTPVARGHVAFRCLRPRRAVAAMLPSTREIRYTDVRVEQSSQWPFGFSYVLDVGKRVYGGLLTENIVSAVARDVLVDAIRFIQTETSWRIALHIHDSIVVECPLEHAEAAKADLIGVLSRSPTWARGLPLAAEAKVSNHLT